jgi:diadenosine tetraphosphate (Ap4A) HIT family hydrolase/predicted alpha/beta hydrolase family esterase
MPTYAVTHCLTLPRLGKDDKYGMILRESVEVKGQLFVATVKPGSLSEKAGVREHDVVFSIGEDVIMPGKGITVKPSEATQMLKAAGTSGPDGAAIVIIREDDLPEPHECEDDGKSLRVVIIPGVAFNEEQDMTVLNFYPWLQAKLLQHPKIGEVVLRQMPEPVKALRSVWVPHMLNELRCDERTIVVGHSSGALATMRLLQEHKLAGAVLLSVTLNARGYPNEQATGLYPLNEDHPKMPVDGGAFQWGTIRKNANGNFAVLHSDNDPWISLDEPRVCAEQLGVELNIQKGASHFQFPCDGIYQAVDRVASDAVSLLQQAGTRSEQERGEDQVSTGTNAPLTTLAQLLKELGLESLKDTIAGSKQAGLTLARCGRWIRASPVNANGSLKKAGIVDDGQRKLIIDTLSAAIASGRLQPDENEVSCCGVASGTPASPATPKAAAPAPPPDTRTLFTKIMDGDIPSSKVAGGDKWYAFLDINPRRPGHTLVVPKEEKQRITDLSPASRAALLDGVAEVERKLTAKFKTTDFFVCVHDGPAAGQEVPHVHFHVIPREKGDGAKDMLAVFPNSPAPGSKDPDFGGLAALSKELVAL